MQLINEFQRPNMQLHDHVFMTLSLDITPYDRRQSKHSLLINGRDLTCSLIMVLIVNTELEFPEWYHGLYRN